MLFQPDLGGRDNPVDDRQQAGVARAMPAALDGNSFEAEIDGGEMPGGGNTGLAQDRYGEVSAGARARAAALQLYSRRRARQQPAAPAAERPPAEAGCTTRPRPSTPKGSALSARWSATQYCLATRPALHLLILDFAFYVADLAPMIAVLWRNGS